MELKQLLHKCMFQGDRSRRRPLPQIHQKCKKTIPPETTNSWLKWTPKGAPETDNIVKNSKHISLNFLFFLFFQMPWNVKLHAFWLPGGAQSSIYLLNKRSILRVLLCAVIVENSSQTREITALGDHF